MGPGCYQTQAQSLGRLKLKSILLSKTALGEQQGFGTQLNNNRYAYISENQATRMRTPGKYSYSDNRRSKRSHNKAFNEYTTIAERPPIYAKNEVPGPGTYLDDELTALPYFKSTHTIRQKVDYSNSPSGKRAESIQGLVDASARKLTGLQTIPPKRHHFNEESMNRHLPQLPGSHAAKPRVQTIILRKNMQSILENVSKLKNINNKTILDTKRGKNNPSSMFQIPRNTQDPGKKRLNRVYSQEPTPNSRVPVGAYEAQKYLQMGDQSKDDELLEKLKTREYSMFEREVKNKKWIDKARKDYEAKYENAGDSMEQFID